MKPRESFGTEIILGTLTRSKDWTEPYAEGDHCLSDECHVGDD